MNDKNLTPETLLKKRLLEIAERRGYSEYCRNGDGDMYMFNHESGICLTLWLTNGNFNLKFIPKHFSCHLTTDVCGSFDNENHFTRIEQKVLKYAEAMKAVDLS